MTHTIIYGIKNCDTMKKAFKWLDEHDVPYHFHDYKKEGVPADVIEQAIIAHGWENVINKRGTTWRKLPDTVKDTMDTQKARAIAIENPSIIKRPLLITGKKHILGFKPDIYADIF